MSGGPPLAVGLLGDPVDHSLSPAIHDAAFHELAVEARYVALRVRAAELPHLMRAFARSGGGNVTLPHKRAAGGLVEEATPEARLTGACNCFWSRDGVLWGDNTDVAGFRAALEAWGEGPSLAGARVLLLGAGGAARAVAAACVDAGASHLEIRNRTLSRARELAGRFGGRGTELTAAPLDRTGGGEEDDTGESRPYDLAVNATSLGLNEDDPLPADLRRLGARAAFDLVYGPDGTPWTRHAGSLGIPAADGLEMLIRQAGLSIRRWFGLEAPLEEMRKAARRGLGR